MVKGKKDYLADETGILETVDAPVEEAMEAIGGTGDTLTGLVSVLMDTEMDIKDAAVIAMRANRLAGRFAKPTPATQIAEIILHIPKALRQAMDGKGLA